MDSTAASEPRIALDVVVCVGGRPLRVFDHHADNRAASRTAGLTELRNLVAPEVGRGILVAGDFNERPEGPDVKSLMDAGLFDLLTFGNEGPAAPGPRIDYLMADGPLARRVSTASVWRTEKSDHNAVFADLAW
jgi:endonuclease/exonuclease/phosphatase family metal-dependent hydrolase